MAERPHVALLNDPKFRSVVFQVALAAIVALLVYAAATNAITHLQRANIASGFGFWNNAAGFDISQTLIPYSANVSTYGQAFWVGLLNTLLVAFLNPNSGRNASAILNAKDPVSAWRDYELSGGKKLPKPQGTASRETVDILQKHQTLMDNLGANATPAIYYLNADNELQQVVGMPDEKQLEAMFGPKP